MLLLTEDGSIIAARDQWGRTPVVIGKKEGAYAATSESSVFRIWIMRLTDIWVGRNCTSVQRSCCTTT